MRGGRRADGYGRIGHFDVQRVAVGLGIDRNGFDPHAARGFDDPAGDLAAIGNQDLLEHCGIKLANRLLCLCGVGAKMSIAAAD